MKCRRCPNEQPLTEMAPRSSAPVKVPGGTIPGWEWLCKECLAKDHTPRKDRWGSPE